MRARLCPLKRAATAQPAASVCTAICSRKAPAAPAGAPGEPERSITATTIAVSVPTARLLAAVPSIAFERS